MNGLKYIRTKCNYSQRALAEVMGVSRQAINMWENSKKLPSKERKEDLCNIFGIDNSDYFGEITDEQHQKLKELPIYRIHSGLGRVNDLHLNQSSWMMYVTDQTNVTQ